MSRWSDPDRIRRDLVIVRWHPAFDDIGIIDGLRRLKRIRRDQRREPTATDTDHDTHD